jgi:hypothetical protein
VSSRPANVARPFADLERGPAAWIVALSGESPERGARVLARQGSVRQHGGGDHAGARRVQGVDHCLVLGSVRIGEAVGELRGTRRRSLFGTSETGCFRDQLGRPVENSPSAHLPRCDQLIDGPDYLLNGQPVGRSLRVDEVEMFESHSLERSVELLRGRLLGPELPPELVRDDDLVALPAGGAKQLSEHDLGVPGPNWRRARLVVVARVVEKIDAVLACRRHHSKAGFGWNAVERAPRSEREHGDLHSRCAERPVLHPWWSF